MLYEISRTDVWVGEIDDRPGGLAERLDTLKNLGANLEFVIVRRLREQPGKALLFVSPLRGAAAHEAGLAKANNMCCVRIEGPDRVGLGAEITRTVAEAGVSLRGFSGAAIGDRNAIYISFDSVDDANLATSVLSKALADTQAFA